MGRKLLLSQLGFPKKFIDSSITPSDGTSKQEYMEKKVVHSINQYNPKLNITSIEYLDIKEQFPHLKIGIYTGLIVEDFRVNEEEKDKYNEREYFVWKSNEEWYVRKIVIYVFLSDFKVKGRNIISQSIFPEIIDFMGLYNTSPSFSIANHPIYYINILDKKITAPTIIKQIAGMIVSDIEYIEVFTQNEELSNVPKDIYEYVSIFEKDFATGSTTFVSEYYEVNFLTKVVKIKTDKLTLGDYLTYKSGTEYQFKGSSEKFYWMEIVPIVSLAVENGYIIDYSLLEEFYNQYKDNFSENDEKFQRFYILLKFIKKLMLRGE